MPTETPTRDRVLLYEPYRFTENDGGSGACDSAVKSYDYKVTHFADATNPHEDPTCTVRLFRRLLESGDYGVIHVVSHGSARGFAVEVYNFSKAGRVARDKALAEYLATGYTSNQLYESSVDNKGYHVSVTADAIRAWSRDRNTIVFQACCRSASLSSAWNAREVIGYSTDQSSDQADSQTIYTRLIGTRDRGTGNQSREVGQAVQGVSPGSLVHRGGGNTVLCPIVKDYGPQAALACSTEVEGFVEFDSTVDTSQDPTKVISARGCAVALTKQRWDGNQRLRFSARGTKCPDDTTFRVDFRYAISANNRIKLDGNKLPVQGGNGVSPNRDYFEWTVRCEPTSRESDRGD